jgi:hypothetical protein
MHKHTYIYYSNNFDLRKIQVIRNLQEQNDRITRGAHVLYSVPCH